jgi:hypothetical protein
VKKTLYIIGILILLVSVTAYAASKWETYSAQAFGGAVLDDDNVAGTIDLAASSAQYTLPGTRSLSVYIVCARGNRAYVECGANPTVTTSAGGYTFSVPDGGCIGPLRFMSAKCAHIAGSAAGQIEFLHINSGL